MTDKQSLRHALFATSAVRVASPDQPFWYASGQFGPFYINTHFLYGGEASANAMLAIIEEAAADPERLPELAGRHFVERVSADSAFREWIDRLAGIFPAGPGLLITGGERRDFFFSMPLASRLSCGHVAILKNGQAVLGQPGTRGRLLEDGELAGRTVVHVADLVTEASSYERSWLPALRRIGATIRDSLAVVDRGQGGGAVLARHGVRLESLIAVDGSFFRDAVEDGLLDAAQLAQVLPFLVNPERYMREFVLQHPDFLDRAVAEGGKIGERAERCRRRLASPSDE